MFSEKKKNHIDRRIVLITGGAGGIGKATANKFLEKGYIVIIIDNDKNACASFHKTNNLIIYNADITDYNNISLIVDEMFKEFGNIDILINNAAIQTTENVLKINLNDWKKVIDVNINGTFILSQLVSRKMKSGSTILNIISTHYNKPRVHKLHYDVSKAGIEVMTKGFALELAKRKITVNAIAIGATFTNMNSGFKINRESVKLARERIPLKKICQPTEVAQYIYNIINDFSKYKTGSTFIIDGGRNLV